MDEVRSLKLRGFLMDVLADSENRVRLAMDILHEATHEERFDIAFAAIRDVHNGMATNERVMATFLQTDRFYRSMDFRAVANQGRLDYKERLRAVYKADVDLLNRMMEALGNDT